MPKDYDLEREMGRADRDDEKERLATEYFESQAASQPEQITKYEDRRGQ
jgi:hypothetical protein